MKNKSYGIYCISVLLLVIAASVYPIIMGARILADWLPDGIVAAADYPKYVIPIHTAEPCSHSRHSAASALSQISEKMGDTSRVCPFARHFLCRRAFS